MLNHRRSRIPRVDGMTIDGTPVELAMLTIGSGGVSIDAAEPSVSTETIPGMPGTTDVTIEDDTGAAYPGDRTITVNIIAIGGEDDINAAKQWLGALNGRTTSIAWRGLPGEYRGRLAVGAWTDAWANDRQTHSKTDITLTAGPYLHGRRTSRTLTAGANTIAVKGNRPCWPSITLTPASGATTASITDARGRKIAIIAATTLTGTITIATDPHNRETRINGNLTTPTLDSDYFPLIPGANKLTLAGCTGSIEWEPSTLI